MQEYARKLADLLEQVALKIRSLTVDRAARVIRMIGLGILATALALTALIFLFWALFGVLEIPLTTTGAFALLGALLLATGSYVWFKRT